MNIGNIEINSKFFLAPMEAVNCASFRVLCKRRGAGLVYTDMIDSDEFIELKNNSSEEEAIKKLINPQEEERPLVVQIAGAKVQNLKETIQILEKHQAADIIDFNCGCPLGKMLGKKAGGYFLKHPDQLYKLLKELRQTTTLPLTLKIRSGWDETNAEDIAQIAEELELDALTIHPRFLKQGYRGKANWDLAKPIKQNSTIPIILSGDVFNPKLAQQAFRRTKCDAIMIGRAAQTNPSVFTLLNNKETSETTSTYWKHLCDPVKDFKEWISLYHELESRNKLSEIRDHALWTATECINNKDVTQDIMNAKDEVEIIKIIEEIKF